MDEIDKAALVAALSLPQSLARPLTRYLKMFSPPKRALTGKKKQRLLEELARTVSAGEVKRHGVVHPAPLAYWEEALEKILASPPAELPLQDHHYLYQVVWAMSERAEQRQAQAAEISREKATAQSGTRTGGLQAVGERLAPRPSPDEWRRGVAMARAALHGGGVAAPEPIQPEAESSPEPPAAAPSRASLSREQLIQEIEEAMKTAPPLRDWPNYTA